MRRRTGWKMPPEMVPVLLTLLTGVGSALAAVGVAMWRQAIKRIDKVQSDADTCRSALQECIGARAAAEAKLGLHEKRLRKLESHHLRVQPLTSYTR